MRVYLNHIGEAQFETNLADCGVTDDLDRFIYFFQSFDVTMLGRCPTNNDGCNLIPGNILSPQISSFLTSETRINKNCHFTSL